MAAQDRTNKGGALDAMEACQEVVGISAKWEVEQRDRDASQEFQTSKIEHVHQAIGA